MITALDSNVILAIWSGEEAAHQMAAAIQSAGETGRAVISAPVFSEILAHPDVSLAAVREFLVATRIHVDFNLSEKVWEEAGLRYARYAAARRRGAPQAGPRRLLADFLIGAHALLVADRFLTLDMKHYRAYFPEVVFYQPQTP